MPIGSHHLLLQHCCLLTQRKFFVQGGESADKLSHEDYLNAKVQAAAVFCPVGFYTLLTDELSPAYGYCCEI